MKQSSILALSLLLLATIVVSSKCQDEDYDDCEPEDDPCATVRCGYGARCEVEDGQARCVCPQYCTKLYDPVCGSDGRTYSNACELGVYNCKNQDNVEAEYKGRCGDEVQEMDIADN